VAKAGVFDLRSKEIRLGFDLGEGVVAVKGGPYRRRDRHFVNTTTVEYVREELPGLVLEPALYPWFKCTPI
jgi:hypothetical protein